MKGTKQRLDLGTMIIIKKESYSIGRVHNHTWPIVQNNVQQLTPFSVQFPSLWDKQNPQLACQILFCPYVSAGHF